MVKSFTISSLEEWNQYKKEHEIIFFFIHADWCQPCQWIKNTLFEYMEKKEVANSVFLKIEYDVWKNQQDWVSQFPEKVSLPAFYIFYRNEFFKPIIPVDMRFIEPFVDDKLGEIERQKNIEMNENF
jgi:thiol-disulfide isomerase/thioredoxin